MCPASCALLHVPCLIALPHVPCLMCPSSFALPHEIFFNVTTEIVTVFTGGSIHLLKFTGGMRSALLRDLSPKELYGCVDSSWSITLTAVGLFSPSKCSELAKKGANTWLPTKKDPEQASHKKSAGELCKRVYRHGIPGLPQVDISEALPLNDIP
eukprot:s1100_g7.t1